MGSLAQVDKLDHSESWGISALIPFKVYHSAHWQVSDWQHPPGKSHFTGTSRAYTPREWLQEDTNIISDTICQTSEICKSRWVAGLEATRSEHARWDGSFRWASKRLRTPPVLREAMFPWGDRTSGHKGLDCSWILNCPRQALQEEQRRVQLARDQLPLPELLRQFQSVRRISILLGRQDHTKIQYLLRSLSLWIAPIVREFVKFSSTRSEVCLGTEPIPVDVK